MVQDTTIWMEAFSLATSSEVSVAWRCFIPLRVFIHWWIHKPMGNKARPQLEVSAKNREAAFSQSSLHCPECFTVSPALCLALRPLRGGYCPHWAQSGEDRPAWNGSAPGSPGFMWTVLERTDPEALDRKEWVSAVKLSWPTSLHTHTLLQG